ncbi:hypothetical protein BDF14DRAFT_1523102 [Spinellus fusiger]|nr:hypothetical protein BDF14DRAFT_1523102 [Spinellus fusiger]
MDSIHILTCHDPSSYNSKVVARKEKSHLEKNTLETVFMTQYSSKCMDLSEKNVTSQCMWLDYELNSDNNNNNNNNNGSTGGGGGGGGDNNDDDNTKNKNTKNIQGIYDKKPSTSHRTQQYQGIWPWFGYNPSNTSKESSSKDNINSQTESLTEANEHNKCHDSTETNDSDKHPYSSHSYPSLDRENDEQNTKDKRSVSSNKEKNSQEDAVIIESTSVHRVEEQHTKIDAAKNKIKAKLRLNPASLSDNHTSTDTLYDQQESAEMSESVQEETIATVHRKPNIVLPSFQSQFHSTPPPLPPPVTTEPKNVLRKALNIVHSLFSGTHPTSKETTLITENPFSGLVNKMKLDPKDMSGKRIVVVGVHGWFPMKAITSSSLYEV